MMLVVGIPVTCGGIFCAYLEKRFGAWAAWLFIGFSAVFLVPFLILMIARIKGLPIP